MNSIILKLNLVVFLTFCCGVSYAQIFSGQSGVLGDEISKNLNGESFLLATVNSNFRLYKLNDNNEPEWIKEISLPGGVDGNSPSLAFDGNNNIFIVGQHSYSDKGLIIKLSGDGELIWGRGATESETFVRACAVGPSGDLFFSGTTNFVTSGNSDAYLGRMSSRGNLSWLKTIGGTGNDHFTGIEVTDVEVVAAGTSIAFGGSGRNALLTRVDYTGEVISINSYSSSVDEQFYHSIVSEDGYRWSVGVVTIANLFKSLIVKSDDEGNIIFSKYFGDAATEFSWRGVNILEISGDLYISSRVESSGGQFVTVSKMTNDGSLAWTQKLLDIDSHVFEYWGGNLSYNSETEKIEVAGKLNTGNQPMAVFSFGLTPSLDSCAESLEMALENYTMTMNTHFQEHLTFDFVELTNVGIENIDFSSDTFLEICPSECQLQIESTYEVDCQNGTAIFEFTFENAVGDVVFTGESSVQGEFSGDFLELADLTPGEYLIEVFAEDANGCLDSLEVNFTIEAELALENIANVILCEGESIQILPTAQNYTSFEWSDGHPSFNRAISSLGIYSLTVTNACESLTSSFEISTFSPLVLEPLENMVLCEEESVQILPTAENYTSFEWSDGYPNLNRELSSSGVYSLTVSNACESMVTEFEVLNESNLLLTIDEEYSFCEGDTMIFNIEGLTGINVNDEYSELPLMITEEGSYNLDYVGQNCSFFQIVEFGYMDSLGPTLETILPDTICLPFETSAYFDLISNYSYSFIEDEMTVYDSEGCFGSLDSHKVVLIDCFEDCELDVFIPNVFSPNSDEYNSVFSPIITCQEKINKYRFIVFNRWGDHIYSSDSVSGNWNGKNEKTGENCNNGVYYWVMNYQSNDTEVTNSGTITLLR